MSSNWKHILESIDYGISKAKIEMGQRVIFTQILEFLENTLIFYLFIMFSQFKRVI